MPEEWRSGQFVADLAPAALPLTILDESGDFPSIQCAGLGSC